jgi:hypothetical protein
MPKQLFLKNLDSHGGLTVKELKTWLEQYQPEAPVVLRCGRIFRLGKMLTSVATQGPILIGRRTALR